MAAPARHAGRTAAPARTARYVALQQLQAGRGAAAAAPGARFSSYDSRVDLGDVVFRELELELEGVRDFAELQQPCAELPAVAPLVPLTPARLAGR